MNKINYASTHIKLRTLLLSYILFDKIFYQERLFKENNLSPDEIKTKRNSVEYLNIIKELKTQLENVNASPSSSLGIAVAYNLNNFKEMTTFLQDGHIPVENNLAERGIKTFVIGRKNFLFCNTEKWRKNPLYYLQFYKLLKQII